MNAAARAQRNVAANRGVITLSVMLAAALQVLDTTITNVALPRIQGSLSCTQEQMAWVLTSYIVASAVTMPLTGWLTDRLGRRRMFIGCVLGFTVASVACGLSQSLPELVGARLLQGVCGAGLMPLSQAILLDINPPERHAAAMSTWAMGVAVGPIFGPALGGWLTEHYSWRWVFFINLPVGVMCVLGLLAFMPDTPRRESRFDFFGFAALGVAIGAVQLLLDRGQGNDWFNATETWIEATAAGLGLYLFIVHVLTTRAEPFVNLALFKDRNFVTGNLFICLVGALLYASMALQPPMLQGLMGYPTETTGWVTAPRGVPTVLAMFLIPWLMRRFDARLIIGFGFALASVALWLMSGANLQMDQWYVIQAGMMQGMGLGLIYVPIVSSAFTTLAPQLRNEGTAFFSLARNLGSSIGISVVMVLLARNTQTLHARLVEYITPFGDGLGRSFAGLPSSAAGLAQVDALVERQAAMMAYNNDFRLLLWLSLCALPLVLVLRPLGAARGGAPVVAE